MDNLDKILIESSLFENLQTKGYSDLLIALKLADEKIVAQLAKTSGEWTRTRLNAMRKLINDEITKAYGGLFATLQDEALESANIAYGLMVGQLGVSVPIGVVNDIINSNRNIQGYTFNELFKLTQDNHARQLRIIIASGVAQGDPVDKIIRDYQLKSDKLTKGNIRTNIFTLISESRTEGRNQAYRDLEKKGVVKEYEYFATLDSNTTSWCRQHDGKKYKTLEDINKDLHTHFNERSVALALTGFELADKRASQFGAVDRGENYESWFKKQSDEFKKSTLSNRKYQDYLDGKAKVTGLGDLDKKTTLNSINTTISKII